MSEPILRSPILKALFIHTTDGLAAGLDEGGFSVDVSEVGGLRVPPEGIVVRIMNAFTKGCITEIAV